MRAVAKNNIVAGSGNSANSTNQSHFSHFFPPGWDRLDADAIGIRAHFSHLPAPHTPPSVFAARSYVLSPASRAKTTEEGLR